MLINWVAALQPLTSGGGWYWGLDDKFKISRYGQPADTPWLHAPVAMQNSEESGLDCGLLTIYHNYVFQQKSVHSYCMECYKVVVVLETLEQVHKVADWQQSECADLGWPCKVGAERRKYTAKHWGAYFYCRGLEKGRERFEAVREWVDNNLGSHINVILKRACTEFEQSLGESDKWELLPGQEDVEKEGSETIEYSPMPHRQAEAIQHHVYDTWDDWDRQTQKPVTYHETEE